MMEVETDSRIELMSRNERVSLNYDARIRYKHKLLNKLFTFI